jgi:protein arginine N-methyltransferase 7
VSNSPPANQSQGGTVIPTRATVWAQLVQAPSLFSMYPTTDQQGARCTALDIDSVFNAGHVVPLSAPFRVFDFDFYQPPLEGRTVQVQVPAHTEGTVHGVVLWWRTELDTDGHIVLSTAPNFAMDAESQQPTCALLSEATPPGTLPLLQQQWREHWQPCWYASAEGIDVTDGVEQRESGVGACQACLQAWLWVYTLAMMS